MEVDRLPDGRPLAQLSLAEIKEQCALRNLSKNGSRKDLTDRLKLRLELEKLREEASRALAKEDVVPNIGLQDTPVGQSDIVRQYLEAQQRRLLLFGVHRPHFENTAPIQETTPSDERKRPIAQKTKGSLKQNDLLGNTPGATRDPSTNADGQILDDLEETTSAVKATRGRSANHKLKVDETPARKKTRYNSNDASNSISKALEDSSQLGPKRRRIVRGSPIQADGLQTPTTPSEFTPQGAEGKEGVKRGRGRPRKIKDTPPTAVLSPGTLADQDRLSDPKVDFVASGQAQLTVKPDADEKPIVPVSDKEDNRTTRAKRLRSQEETPQTLQEKARVPPPASSADPASSEASLEDPIEAALLAMHGVEDATKSPKRRNLPRSATGLDSPLAETTASRERSKVVKPARTKETPPVARETSKLIEEKESKEVFARKSVPIPGSPRPDIKRTGGNERTVRETRKRSKVENIVQKLTQDKVEAADIAAKAEASLAKRPRKENGQAENSKLPDASPPSSGVSPDDCVLRLLGAGPKLEKSDKRPLDTPKTSKEKKAGLGSPRDKKSKDILPVLSPPTSRRTRRGLSSEGIDATKSESETTKSASLTPDATNPIATIDSAESGRRDSVEAAVAALIGEPLEPRNSEESPVKRATRKTSRDIKLADELQQQHLQQQQQEQAQQQQQQQQSLPAAVSQPSTRSSRSLRSRETSTEAETVGTDCPEVVSTATKEKLPPTELGTPISKAPEAALQEEQQQAVVPKPVQANVEIRQAVVVEGAPPSKLEQVVAKCETRRSSAGKNSSESKQSKLIGDINVEESIKPDAAVAVAAASVTEVPEIIAEKPLKVVEPAKLDDEGASTKPNAETVPAGSELQLAQESPAASKDHATISTASETLRGQLEQTTHNNATAAVAPISSEMAVIPGAPETVTENEDTDGDPDELKIVENDREPVAQQSQEAESVVVGIEKSSSLPKNSVEDLGGAEPSREHKSQELAEPAVANHLGAERAEKSTKKCELVQKEPELEPAPQSSALLECNKDIASDIEQEVSSKPQPEQDDLWEAVFCGDQEGNPSSEWPEGNDNEDPSSSYRQSDLLDDSETNISDTPGIKLPHKFQPNVESAVASILDLNDIMRPSSSLSSHGGQNDNDTAVIDNVPDADSAVAGLLSEVPFDDDGDHADLCIDDEVVSEAVPQEYDEAIPENSAGVFDQETPNPSDVGEVLQEISTCKEAPERRISEEVRSVTGDVVESVATTSLLVDATEQQQRQTTPSPKSTEQTSSAPLGPVSKLLEIPSATETKLVKTPPRIAKEEPPAVKGSVNLSEESSSDSDSEDLGARSEARLKQRDRATVPAPKVKSEPEPSRRKTAAEQLSKSSAVQKSAESKTGDKKSNSLAKLAPPPSVESSSSSSSSSSGASSSESSSSDDDDDENVAGRVSTKSQKACAKPSATVQNDQKSQQVTTKKQAEPQTKKQHKDSTEKDSAHGSGFPESLKAPSEKNTEKQRNEKADKQAKQQNEDAEVSTKRQARQEEVRKQRGEEAERSRKQQEEEAKELREQQEAEAETLRKQQELEADKLRKKQEEEAERLRKQQNEEDEKVRLRLEEEEKLRLAKEAEDKLRQEREAAEKAQKEREEEERERKRREEEEEKIRKQIEEAENARKQLEEEEKERKRLEEEEKERKRLEDEEEARKLLEEEEKLRKRLEEEENARKLREEEEKARKLKEKEEKARKQKEEEEKARKLKEKEEKARKLKEEEEKARKQKEEEEKARKLKEEEEEKARKLKEEEEEKARKQREEEIRLQKKREEEEIRRQEQEEEDRLRKLAEEELRKKQEAERILKEREAAKLRKQKEAEEERLRKEEAEKLLREKREEEEKRRKLEEEESLRKQQEAEKLLREKREEEEKRRKLEEEESLRKQQEAELLRKKRQEEENLRRKQEEEERLRKEQEEAERLQNQREELLKKQQEADQLGEQKRVNQERIQKQLKEESGKKETAEDVQKQEAQQEAEQPLPQESTKGAPAATTPDAKASCSSESPAFKASTSSNDASGGSRDRQPTGSSRGQAATGMMVGSNSQQRKNPLVSYGFDSEDEDDEDGNDDDDDVDDDDEAANASEAVAKDNPSKSDIGDAGVAEAPPSCGVAERLQDAAESSGDFAGADVSAAKSSDDSGGVQVSSSHTTGVFTHSVASPGMVGGVKKFEVTSSSDNSAELRTQAPHDQVEASSGRLDGDSDADKACDAEPCDQGLAAVATLAAAAPNDCSPAANQAETASSSDESARSLDEGSQRRLHSQSAESASSSSSAEMTSSTDRAKIQNAPDGASSSSDGLNSEVPSGSAARAPSPDEIDLKTCVASSSPTQTTADAEELGQQPSSDDACSSSDKLPKVDRDDPAADTSDRDLRRTEVQSSSEASLENPLDASSSSDKKDSADSYADSSSPQQTTSNDRVESRTDGEGAPSSSDQQTSGTADSRIENSAEAEPDSDPVRASVESSEEASGEVTDDNSVDASDDPTRPKCCSSSTASMAERSSAPVEEFESGRPRCESTSETNRTSRINDEDDDDDDDFEENSQPELPGACTSSHSQQHSGQHAASEQADPLSNAADEDKDISSSNNNNTSNNNNSSSSSSNDNNNNSSSSSSSNANNQATSEASSAGVDAAKNSLSRPPEERTSISSSDAQSSQRPADFSLDESSGMAQSSDEPRAQMLASPLQDYGAIPDGNEVSASSSSSSATGENQVNTSSSVDKDSPAPTPSSSSCKPDVKLSLSSSVEDVASSEAIPMEADNSKEAELASVESPSAEENADSSQEDENPSSSSTGPNNKESKEASSS